MYRFSSLQETSLQQVAECFNSAFSDYEQPIHFTAESLKYYLTASAVDLSLSYGAFCGEQLVGIILNSGGIYNGEAVVFDAGTGIVPEHRGKKLFSALFDYTCQQLQARGIQKYYLEVLQANEHAVAIYSKKGFSVLREFSVLVATGPHGRKNDAVTATPYESFKAFETRFSVAPSYEHTSHTLGQNPQLYEVLSLADRACCVYAKRQGAIVQLHYSDLQALQDVLTALTERFPSAMAKNIDLRYDDVLQALAQIGFKEVTRQYEMVKPL